MEKQSLRILFSLQHQVPTAPISTIASTNSFYLVPVDFTQPQLGSPVRLPYQPNSMVISNDGSTVYMGSSFELMTFSAATNSLGAQDTTVPGSVLAVSPDGTTLVITDPVRQFVYLYNTSGTIQTQYGGVGTHAVFSPDSTTVYITLGNYDASTGVTTPNNQLLVHSTFTGWYQTANNASQLDHTGEHERRGDWRSKRRRFLCR